MLEIRKLGNKHFTHDYANFNTVSASDILAVFEGNYIKISLGRGTPLFKSDGFLYSEVRVYDETDVGIKQVYSSIDELQQALIDLGYVAFDFISGLDIDGGNSNTF